MTPALEASGLAVGRGRSARRSAPAAVLSGVDLAIQPGERVALVGRNGAGKTTLLRAFAGLDQPLAGEIRWAGGSLPHGAARVRRVGVLLQGEPASPFTVRALVTLGLALDRPPGPREQNAVDAAIALAGLGALAERRCAQLSGGEAQRALIARALVAAPPLLVLDEPTNHLDPAGRAMIEALIDQVCGPIPARSLGEIADHRAVHRLGAMPAQSPDHLTGQALGPMPAQLPDHRAGPLPGGVAVVIATHDLALAATCDRVALLADGRLAALGPPGEILTPARLADALGAQIRRLDDPEGGPPAFRIARPRREVAA